ncbi:hypothetical protein HanRHA438_Chr01g0043801 [Helianthus annuus]|nr:hypothetical protein HanRHA438_Chr01g0043801 [Helianthus annuus]
MKFYLKFEKMGLCRYLGFKEKLKDMCLFQEKKMTLRSLLNQRPAADLGVAHGSESIAATLGRRY